MNSVIISIKFSAIKLKCTVGMLNCVFLLCDLGLESNSTVLGVISQ